MIPYEGREPYIFISYAHKDSDIVFPIIEAMYDRGFRIWYDAGIEAGTEWPEYIAEHLENASAVIAFLSNSALESINCRQEINEAINQKKDFLAIHLHELTMTAGMRMRLSLIQAMFMYRHSSMENFCSELFRAKILAPCLAAKEQVVPAPAPIATEATVSATVAQQQIPTQETSVSLPETPPQQSVETSNPEDFVIKNGVLVAYKGNASVVKIPDGVVSVGYAEQAAAMVALAGIKEVFPFQKNRIITDIIIPEGVERIGHMAFAHCESLKRVSIPESVKHIDSWAFWGCFELCEIEFSQNSQLEIISESAFENCSSLVKLSLPKGLTDIKKNAFRACANMVSIRIPLDAKMDSIKEDTFHSCASLEEVTLPNSVTTIEQGAFYGCESLWDINFPKSLKEIGERAFCSCEKLEWVDCGWLGSLESVGKEAFLNCRSLKTVNLSSTLKTIDEDAFTGCISLGRVELPRKTKMPMFKQVFPKHTVVKRT